MKIELLYFDGCPGWQEALKNLKAALAVESPEAEIHLVKVEDNARAASLKFLGSPSFRINGQELWPEERQRYNLSCRVYLTSKGLKSSPTVEMLRERLRAMNSTKN
jgi:hypothetical protein